jgi:hypothetical protein
MSAQPDLPLRPMTLGEVLDAAVTLLRARAVPLLALAGVLAAVEQVVLAPLRESVGASAPWFGPAQGQFGAWWVVFSAGFGFEAFIICVVGALAAAAAGPALLGRQVATRELWRRMRPLSTLAAAVVLGAVCAVAAFCGLVPWVFAAGLLGLVSGVIVIDRAGPNFVRAVRLAGRDQLRGLWTRMIAYGLWAAVRLVLGAGWVTALDAVTGSRPDWVPWLAPVAWWFADTIAYAALGCVDAVLLLETRIRTEGLDIAIGRARSRGEDEAGALVWAP